MRINHYVPLIYQDACMIILELDCVLDHLAMGNFQLYSILKPKLDLQTTNQALFSLGPDPRTYLNLPVGLE